MVIIAELVQLCQARDTWHITFMGGQLIQRQYLQGLMGPLMLAWFDTGEHPPPGHPPAHSHPCGLFLSKIYNLYKQKETTGIRMSGWVFASVKPGAHGWG